MWPGVPDVPAAFRSGWRPCLALSLIGWAELVVVSILGLRPDAVLSTIAGPIGVLSHDITLGLALPLPIGMILFMLLALMGARIMVYAQLTNWPLQRWIGIWVLGLIAVTPIGVALLAFGLTGVPYLWAAATVFAVALTGAMAPLFGQYGWQAALISPAFATLIGGIARLLPTTPAVIVIALGVPIVALASVMSFNPVPGPIRPVKILLTILTVLGVVMGGTGVLYILLQPSPKAPPAIQRQLVLAQASDDPVRVILVDGFNTSRSTLPWLGTPHPATWFSYAGLDHAGNPLPYRQSDTLSGIYANTQALATQIQVEAVRGKVTLVGISQGTWIISATIAQYPQLKAHIERVVLIDTPLAKDWIDIYAPNTHAGLELIGALVRAITPVIIDSQGPLAQELTSGTLPDLAQPTGISTVWLRSVTDAATITPPLSNDTDVVTYWGAHALTIGLPSGRNAVARVVDGDTTSQMGSEFVAIVIRAIAASWQLPGRY